MKSIIQLITALGVMIPLSGIAQEGLSFRATMKLMGEQETILAIALLKRQPTPIESLRAASQSLADCLKYAPTRNPRQYRFGDIPPAFAEALNQSAILANSLRDELHKDTPNMQSAAAILLNIINSKTIAHEAHKPGN